MDVYDSPLQPEQEQAYLKTFGNDASHDYDMRGFYLDNPDKVNKAGEHYPDTYKKPWHHTFSDESMYHGVGGNQGGTWGKTEDGKDTFAPGPTNMKLHGVLGLIDYFDKYEPDAKLLMPRK